MPKVFISYRRADSEDVTGRIYDRLDAEFGRQNVFKDVDSIPLGVDFRKRLHDEVSRCDVLLAVIGKDWLEIRDERGNRRIDDKADFLRIEIEAALERDIRVVPLLVRNAGMPQEDQLPPSLRQLAFRNAIQIRSDPDFHRDMDRLIRSLRELQGTSAAIEDHTAPTKGSSGRVVADPQKSTGWESGGVEHDSALTKGSSAGAVVDAEKCMGCGECVDLCPTEAIKLRNDIATIDADNCVDCELCVDVCPSEAISVE